MPLAGLSAGCRSLFVVYGTFGALLFLLASSSCSRGPAKAGSVAVTASKGPLPAARELEAKARPADPPGPNTAATFLPGPGTEESDLVEAVNPDHPFPVVPRIGVRPWFLSANAVRQALSLLDHEPFDYTTQERIDPEAQGGWLDQAKGRYVAAVSTNQHGDGLLLFDGTGKPIQRVVLDSPSKLYWADVAGDPTRELLVDLYNGYQCCDRNLWQVYQLSRQGRLKKIGEFWRLCNVDYQDGRSLKSYTCFRNTLTQPRKGELLVTTMEFGESGCEASRPGFPRSLGEKHSWTFDSRRGRFVERRAGRR